MLTSLLTMWLTKSTKPFLFTNQNIFENYNNIDNLGIYVHIPFCRSLCDYCPYCKEIYKKERALQYKNALLKEITLRCHNKRIKKVTSLYFGGGTPALLIEYLSEIITTLQKHFDITEGIGIELHPEDITEQNLLYLKSIGITMISIGIQSFHKQCLKSLNRKKYNYANMAKIIKKANFETVDMDLIFAMPNQTQYTLKKDIEMAFRCHATQISTYPFIDFTFNNNQYKPLSEHKKKILSNTIVRYCNKTNKKRTSVWTFALPDTKKYSSITRNHFIGFGTSAVSLFCDTMHINTFSVKQYINTLHHNKQPNALTLRFTMRQKAVYYLFWHTYTLHIDNRDFKKEIGYDIEYLFRFEFCIAEKLGLIKKCPYGYTITNRGAYYYHYIEQKYTRSYIDTVWRICKKQAFPKKIVLK